MKLRVLVTGSRDWPEIWAHYIHADLSMLLHTPDIKILTVVHGQCPTGADAFAAQWCAAWVNMAIFLGKDVIEEPHPAAWTVFDKRAGSIRNEEMVDLGADLCLAYPLGISPGTRGCMGLAMKAKIMMWNRTADLHLE